MATGTIILPVISAMGDPTNPPALAFTASNKARLAFNDEAAELCRWDFRMPDDYASGPVLKIQWSGAASVTTSHTARWGCEVDALTPDVDGAADADSYATINEVNDDILGTTAKRIQEASITLTNADSAAAGDLVSIRLSRRAAHVDDDLPEDAWVWAVSLTYTTT